MVLGWFLAAGDVNRSRVRARVNHKTASRAHKTVARAIPENTRLEPPYGFRSLRSTSPGARPGNCPGPPLVRDGSLLVRSWFVGPRVVRGWFLGGSWVMLLFRDNSLLIRS